MNSPQEHTLLADAMTQLAPQPISTDVLREKYLKDNESSVQELYDRVARALASVEKPELQAEYEQKFRSNLDAGAIGAGRIMSAAGTGIQATLINCFVQPVGDCIQGVDDEGYPGIYEALREAAETMRRGGGVGYDFSRIRPKGARVKGTASTASGPCSYINVFDQSCATVESAGSRRGAQMGVLRIDHPDVLEFITAKRTPGRWNNFNVSVGVSDAFIEAVRRGDAWELVHPATPGAEQVEQGARQRPDGQWVYRTLPASELWDTIMKSAYDFAEPGILFLDRIQTDNNLRAVESIHATNPCVTADTWVQTDTGARQVQELIGQPFNALVNGMAYAVESQGFFATGTKPVFELQTREGHRLRLTGDHRVRRVAQQTRYTQTLDWTPAAELQPGDQIVLNDHRAALGWEGTGTEAQGYLMGLLIGDGTLKSDKAVISVWAPELRAVGQGSTVQALSGADGVIEAATAAMAELPHRSDFAGFQRPVAGRGERRMASSGLRDLAFSLGMQPGRKTITPEIERQSSDFYAGLLRGLFDADGSVQGSQDKGVSIRLSQSDEELLRSAQRMLLRLGILSMIEETHAPCLEVVTARSEATWQSMDRHGLRPRDDGYFSVAMTGQQEAQHELVISGENLRSYADRVGFADADKAERLQAALAGYRRGLNRERFTATVSALLPCGEESVYDVTVSDVHAFDANGLVVHNCGEQPLPPYGCCDLGPIILTKFVQHAFDHGGKASFDFEAFAQSVALQVRALDNVLELTHWPLPQQHKESQAKRRIGVGFTGLGDTLVMLGLPYNAHEGREMARRIAECMRDAAYIASVELALEKGAFPLFNAKTYLAEGTFASRLPKEIKAQIKQHGIRNSHLLSIAPTGTVSLAFADNASNGIEPAFSWTYTRKKREADGTRSEYEVQDHAYRLYKALGGDTSQLPPAFVGALEMSAEDHIAMMQAVQPYIDTSISKTVNVAENYPYEDFKKLYLQAWDARLKGLATYRPNSILGAVLEVKPAETPKAAAAPEAAPVVDPMRTVIESRPLGALDAMAEKIEYWTQEGHKSLYLIVSFLPVPSGDGKGTVDRAIEFFMPVGQSGESQQWITSSMRLLSLAARGGFLERALSDMRKVAWDRGPVRYGYKVREDGTQVPLWHDSEVAAIAWAIQNILELRAKRQVQADQLALPLPEVKAPAPAAPTAVSASGVMAGKKCPDCGAHAVIKKDGCEYCTQCGFVGACG